MGFATCFFNSQYLSFAICPYRIQIKKWLLIISVILMIDGWGMYCEIVFGRMSLYLINDKSKLVQVMAWCRPATSHDLSQCWARPVSPSGVTRPQLFKPLKCGASCVVCDHSSAYIHSFLHYSEGCCFCHMGLWQKWPAATCHGRSWWCIKR